MQVPAELMDEAAAYLRITALALPFQALMLHLFPPFCGRVLT